MNVDQWFLTVSSVLFASVADEYWYLKSQTIYPSAKYFISHSRELTDTQEIHINNILQHISLLASAAHCDSKFLALFNNYMVIVKLIHNHYADCRM